MSIPVIPEHEEDCNYCRHYPCKKLYPDDACGRVCTPSCPACAVKEVAVWLVTLAHGRELSPRSLKTKPFVADHIPLAEWQALKKLAEEG